MDLDTCIATWALTGKCGIRAGRRLDAEVLQQVPPA
jgi:hypothetical protein